jgi:hypothetical protein
MLTLEPPLCDLGQAINHFTQGFEHPWILVSMVVVVGCLQSIMTDTGMTVLTKGLGVFQLGI